VLCKEINEEHRIIARKRYTAVLLQQGTSILDGRAIVE